MPELLENFLNHLNNEIDSLYSCALVSRHLCKISIPILWQDPFSFDQNPLFISQYFSSLDENEKLGLKEYGINIEFPNTLFNYARFLKFLDLNSFEQEVENWINLQLVTYNTNSVTFVFNLLFKLLAESGATLHELGLHYSNYEINPEIFYLLEQNEQFFSRLQGLSFGPMPTYISTYITLLKILAKNATNISSLKIEEIYYNNEAQLRHAIITFIKSQEQLKQFGLFSEEAKIMEAHGIISALKSQKLSLQEVTLESCNFDEEFETLIDCENLEILRIRYCNYVKILAANLNTLEIIGCSIDTSNMVQILQKSGSLLQRLKFESTDNEVWKELSILETLKSFCPNITHLELRRVELSTHLLELIGNLQNLQFLTLLHVNNIPEEDPEIRVMHFAKILPSTLQYLDIRYSCLYTYIETFLNNCYAPLKNLLIHRIDTEKKS